MEERKRVVDGYGVNLLNSRYEKEKVVDILVSGIRAYERTVKCCNMKGIGLYRTSKESTNSRRIKKLKGSKTLFRKRRNSTDAVDEEDGSVARSRRANRGASWYPRCQKLLDLAEIFG